MALALLGMLFLMVPTQSLASSAEQIFKSKLNAGEKAFQQANYIDAMKLFFDAKKYADEMNSNKNICLSTYDIGLCYYFISENGEALKYYYEAYKMCTDNNLGWKMESKILNGIAGVYFDDENYEKSHEIVKRGYDEALRKRDSALVTTYSLDLALIANKKNRFNESELYLKSARKYNVEGERVLMKILTVETEAMFMQKKYDAVIAISKKLLNNPLSTDENKGIVLIYLIDVYKQRHQMALAFSCAQQAQKFVNIGNKPYLFESISQLYKESGNLKQALAFKDSVIIYNDSLTVMNNRQLTEKSHIKLEVLKMKVDMDKKLSKMKQQHQVFFLLICIFGLLVVIALIVIRNQRVKGRQVKQLMQLKIEKGQHEKLIAEKQMKETELIAHYQHEMMKRSLDQKQHELSVTSMFISSRNELIEDLLKSLSEIKEAQGITALNSLVQHLKQLLKDSNSNDDFLINFESANPDFIKKIEEKHPELSASDIRYLAYIRSNLSTKDIASLLNINPDSCKRKKIRISRKLGLDSSSDLYSYVIKL
jgi:tetratricopeptide (TPR) repeat protein